MQSAILVILILSAATGFSIGAVLIAMALLPVGFGRSVVECFDMRQRTYDPSDDL